MKGITKEASLIQAICRCSMANNPTDAVKHQIRRLIKHYENTGQGHLSEYLEDLFREPEDTNMKIVQSKN